MVNIPPIKMVTLGMVYGIVLPTLVTWTIGKSSPNLLGQSAGWVVADPFIFCDEYLRAPAITLRLKDGLWLLWRVWFTLLLVIVINKSSNNIWNISIRAWYDCSHSFRLLFPPQMLVNHLFSTEEAGISSRIRKPRFLDGFPIRSKSLDWGLGSNPADNPQIYV